MDEKDARKLLNNFRKSMRPGMKIVMNTSKGRGREFIFLDVSPEGIYVRGESSNKGLIGLIPFSGDKEFWFPESPGIKGV